MAKRSLVSGLIAGGIMAGMFMISYALFMKDFKPELFTLSEIVGYANMIIALTAIFFGIKSYRDKVLGGKISFGKAFLLGIGISAVAALIFAIYVYFLYNVIFPGLTDRMIEGYRERIRMSGQTQQVITQELAKFETESAWWHNPFLLSFSTFVLIFVIGILISLVSAAILRRKERALLN